MSACDVAIVGLGPVGATAALLLAEQGLQVTVFESAREIYPLPRAVNLDGEIIRAFQGIGRGDAVQALMQALRPDERAGFADADRQWMFGQTHRAFGPNGWQTTNMFDQPELEQYLRDEIEQHDRIRVHLGTEVTGFREINGENGDANTRIEIDTRTNGGDIKTERARWMIGCDGASSFVRRSLDIGWRSQGYDCDWLVVDVTVRQGHSLPNDTLQVCDPDRITTYVCTKEPYRRWEFKLLPGETREQMLSHETIHALIDTWTPRDTYKIRRAAVYQFHAATATRWQAGPVFIAGDAAHQTPPFLGQGMNAGMRDAVNLSWKLGRVADGQSGEALLKTYETERAGHASDLVDWAVAIGRLMDHLADTARAEREGREPPEPASDDVSYLIVQTDP